MPDHRRSTFADDVPGAADVAARLREAMEAACANGATGLACVAGASIVFHQLAGRVFTPAELPGFFEREAQSARDELTRPAPITRPILGIVTKG